MCIVFASYACCYLGYIYIFIYVSRRMSTQDSADAKMLAYRNLLQHAAQIELLCGMLHPSKYDDAVCEHAQLRHRTSRYGARCLTCLRLETRL